jgi:dolichol-phosphate mannosyltransferase
MVYFFAQGYDVVSPRRSIREGESIFKRATARIFYRAMSSLMDQRLTTDVGDFRLFSHRAVLALRALREQHRFLRGMSSWLGLREIVIPFERAARAGGQTKYPLVKMLRFAWTAVTSFSALPLRLSISAGSILSLAGFVYLFRVVYLALFTNSLVPGWASVVALECAFSGMILLALGVAGDYIARTYEEAKLRPLYVVTEGLNIQFPRRLPNRAIVLNESLCDHDPDDAISREPDFPPTLTRESFNFAETWK